MKRFALALFLVACSPRQTGNVDEPCKPDGTCNGQLVCRLGSEYSFCEPPLPRVEHYRAFCETCADSCADAGLRRCEIGDPSTWGGKSSVCECR